MMLAVFVIVVILVIVMMRVRRMMHLHMMFYMRLIVIVDDHRIHPYPPNRIQGNAEHYQHPQATGAGKPRKVGSLRVG